MEWRFAAENDLDLLAEWNARLIRDEGHRNPMSVPQLRDRMHGWLASEYQAVMFEVDGTPVAYALFRDSADEIYLRQFFVHPSYRRKGIGRHAIHLLQSQIWPSDKRLTVDVLTVNTPAIAFWRSVGYRDYALTLEILPPSPRD